MGNGSTDTTTGTAYIPMQLDGDLMALPVNILDAEALPLLGVSFLNSSGAIVDSATRAAVQLMTARFTCGGIPCSRGVAST